MQREKVLQEAAASAQSQAQDASQHQQELAQENAALRHEIQVSIKTTLCNSSQRCEWPWESHLMGVCSPQKPSKSSVVH